MQGAPCEAKKDDSRPFIKPMHTLLLPKFPESARLLHQTVVGYNCASDILYNSFSEGNRVLERLLPPFFTRMWSNADLTIKTKIATQNMCLQLIAARKRCLKYLRRQEKWLNAFNMRNCSTIIINVLLSLFKTCSCEAQLDQPCVDFIYTIIEVHMKKGYFFQFILPQDKTRLERSRFFFCTQTV